MNKGYLPISSGLILLLSVSLFLSGCVGMQSPEISVQKISITDISLQKMSLRADIQIYNPNSLEVTISDLEVAVSYMDDGSIRRIGHGSYAAITVPAQSVEQISIPVTVDNYDIIMTVLSFVKSGEMRIITTGSGRYKVLFVENTAAFTHETSLSLESVDANIRGTMTALIDTVQSTKTTFEKAKDLVTPVKEGVTELLDIITNNSTVTKA